MEEIKVLPRQGSRSPTFRTSDPEFSPNFHPPIRIRLCGWDAATEGRLPELAAGGSRFSLRSATPLILQYRPSSALVHPTTTARPVRHILSASQVPPQCPTPAPRISRILQRDDLDVSLSRAQSADSEPATNARSFRGDPLGFHGKSHRFQPWSRLFPSLFSS